MAERSFKTYFLRITTGNSPIPFHEMLVRVAAIPFVERTIEVGDSPVRLSSIDRTYGRRGIVCGDLERVQMGNFPLRSYLAQEQSEELDLEEGQGLGHRSAFLYDARSGVLAIQANITGVGANRFKHYVIELLTGQINPIELEFEVVILPEDDAAVALQPDSDFRKLTFSVTDPNTVADTLAHLEGERPIASTMLRAVGQESSSVKMTVTVSVGRSRQHLNPGPITNLINSLLGARGDGANVDKLAVTGVFGGENAELNFLPTKLAYIEKIEIGRTAVPFQERQRLLLRAHEACSQRLQAMFPRDENIVL